MRRDREEEDNRKIDELDDCFPSTVHPNRPYKPLPQPAPKDGPATPTPSTWLKQLAGAKEIFRICEHKEDEDRLSRWIYDLAQTPGQGKAAIQDADSALLDIDNTDQGSMVDIAERNMEAAVRGMKEAGNMRWKELQKGIDTYFQEKNKSAGSPAVGF
ncbi:hypothetical protein LTR85_005634 [Meristemomyces frigidus]|nr:hypothetical protein LTR85_005634 [Meristemomyces frigidus]